MPVFTIQTPTGHTLDIEAPDQATAMAGAQQWHETNAKAPPKPAVPASSPMDTLADMAKSAGAGFMQGVTSLPSTVRDIADAGANLIHASPEYRQIMRSTMPYGLGNVPSSAELNALRQKVTGQDYQPQTLPGQYARTVGQFAPAALAPGSLATRAVNVVAPALASESAGQLTKGTKWEGPARFGAALLTGALVPRASSAILDTKPTVPTLDPAIPQSAARRAQDYVQRVTASGTPMPTLPNKPILAAEAAGKPAQVALGALARRSGATADTLGGLVGERQLTRPARIQQDFETASGIKPEAASGDMDALIKRGREEAAPLYDQAYSAPVEFTPRLESLAKRSEVQSALDGAMKLIENDPAITPEAAAQIKASGTSSPQLWDYAHRALNDRVQALIDPVTGKLTKPTEGRVLTSLSSELNGAIREASPQLGAAWDKGGDYLSASQAYRDGGRLLTDAKLNEQQLADKFTGLTDAQKEAFKGGLANKYYDLAQTGKLDPKVMKTPRVQQKLETVLGKDQASALIQSAGQEGAMQAFERRYGPGGGSPTQEFNAAMKEQDGGNGLANAAADFGMRAVTHGPKGAVVGAITDQLKNLDAYRRTAGMPVAARDEAGRMLMMSPDELKAFLTTLPKRKATSPVLGAVTAGLLAR